MRNYVYIWNNPESNFLVASGIELKDFRDIIARNSGLIFLEHSSDSLKSDNKSGFDFLEMDRDSPLWSEEVYRWGNCIWADYSGDKFPRLSDLDISELLFFKHRARPLNKIAIENLANKYLAFSHDDGFFLKLYYSSWNDAAVLIAFIQKTMEVEINAAEFQSGTTALWIKNSAMEEIEKTMDIDSILSRKIKPENRRVLKQSLLAKLVQKLKRA